MWTAYVILAIWTQAVLTQQDIYLINRQGGGVKNTNSEYIYNTDPTTASNNNTITRLYQVPSLAYNTNSRNSFGDQHLLSHKKETELKNTQQHENPKIQNNLSTTSPLNAIASKTPTTSQIPIGDSFNVKLFDILSSNSQYENLVYSPVAMQTVLAFIFTMSEGQLYEELAQLLAISNNRTHVAKIIENILQTAALNKPPTTLIMANKLYYDQRFGPIDHTVRTFTKKAFDSEMEEIDFFASKKAANKINAWVSERTRNLITEIVTPSTITGDISALLLNSIYFKSEWQTKFAFDDTETEDFYLTRQTKVTVDMMYNEDVFRYGDFTEDLHASAVELPYKDSNISMLLILPHEKEGLAELESKLKYHDFGALSQKLKREIATVKLPRFKIEYEIDMIKPLQVLGLHALFNDAASINLFKNQQKPLKIDQFKHKSFIKVNEAGTEAAAATVSKYIPLSIPSDMKYFIADHPFVFVIRDSNTTFFIGHVVKF